MDSSLRRPAGLAEGGGAWAQARPYAMRRAQTTADWDRVREIRSGSEGAPHGDAGLPRDAAANSMTFVLLRNSRGVGTTRTSASSAQRQWGLPALAVFRSEIESAVGLESTIVESDLTVVDPYARGESRTVLFHLFKAHMLHSVLADADWLITAVAQGEIGFHRRMFNMEILSGAEAYPGLDGARVLMGLDFRKNAALLAKRIPTIAVSPADEAEFVASGRVPFAHSSR